MARIRNIKPDYFRHEALQDLEAANPGLYIMLTYIALWTQCDANGIFPWRPRVLKLDILPFIEYNLAGTLDLLLNAGYIAQFTAADGNTYGHIPTFKKHQRITGKEAIEGKKYPIPISPQSGGAVGATPGNNGETTGKHPDAQGEERITGKDNREREGDNAHAREGQTENQKSVEPAPPPQPSNGGGCGDPYTACYNAIQEWAKPDNYTPLRDYAAGVGYDPAQYGSVADEIKKFTAHWLDSKRHPDDRAAFQVDPAQFFRDKGRKWLLDAKNFNKPKNAQKPPPKPRYEPPPQRTNANATGLITIGDIAGKIITEIT